MSRLALSRLVTVVAALAITCSAVVLAASHPHGQALVGTLQKVDGQTLTVQTTQGTETVMLAPSAKVHAGSKTLAASDLGAQTGSRVKIRYVNKAGHKQAESVMVSSVKK